MSASKLQTARTVGFSGAATGSFNFDGSGNSSAVLTLANSGVTASTYGANNKIHVLTVNAKGLITGVSAKAIPEIVAASTSQKDVVQLNNTLTSTSVTEAATAAQVKILNDKIIGVGQTWQNVKSERLVGSTYNNTTGRSIQLNINTIGAGQIWLVRNGENFAFLGQGASEGGGVTPIILVGDTYSLSAGAIQSWRELR